jgi:hypothetical protein
MRLAPPGWAIRLKATIGLPSGPNASPERSPTAVTVVQASDPPPDRIPSVMASPYDSCKATTSRPDGSNAANGTALPAIPKSRTVDQAPEAFVVSSISE